MIDKIDQYTHDYGHTQRSVEQLLYIQPYTGQFPDSPVVHNRRKNIAGSTTGDCALDIDRPDSDQIIIDYNLQYQSYGHMNSWNVGSTKALQNRSLYGYK